MEHAGAVDLEAPNRRLKSSTAATASVRAPATAPGVTTEVHQVRTFTPPGEVTSDCWNGPAAQAKSRTCLAVIRPADKVPVAGTFTVAG
ncbi:hypothetical protein [Kribbella qitaiheensis]|uniref:hypothetical protein n=1 Tax=Kribbella qitaiheensis TaxID=1544730 RepID=UPI0019D64E07|nr:hypothetical protein [Kribbella qitaiheensis]